MRADVRPDVAIAQLAARQHGVVSHRQLLALGLSRAAIDHRLRRGLLHRVHRGVYLVGHPAATELGPAVAALLAVGSGAHLSHHASAVLWNVTDRDERAIHVTIARRGPQSRPGLVVRRVKMLDPRDTGRRRELPVTSPARTLLDLAGTVSRNELEAAYERARVLRLLQPADVLAAMDRTPGRRGATTLQALIDDRPGLTRSAAERRLMFLIRRGELPTPATNVRIAGHEVDLLWSDARLVVEVDGYAWHRGRRAFEHDRRRDADLQVAGYRVIRVTWRRIQDQPEALLVMLTQALATGLGGHPGQPEPT